MSELSLPQIDLRQYALRPLLLDATRAHREQLVRYDADGTAWLRHPDHERLGLAPQIAIGPEHQFSAIRTTFEDLQRPVLGAPRSPRVDGELTLSQLYERE